MKWTVPALCAASLALAGCTRERPLDGLQILARYHGAEETTPYTVREANDLVIYKAWPVAASATTPPGFLRYGRPVSTVFQHTQHGPDQWRLDVLKSDADPKAAGMVQTRNGQAGWRFVPAAGQLQLQTYPAKDVGAINWLALILSNYQVLGVRRDTVAGVPALHVEVRPNYPGRPSMRLWVDAETYLPLRQESWGADGRLLSVTQALERPRMIPAGDDSDLRLPSLPGVSLVQWDQEYRLPESDISNALGCPLGRLTHVPPGFAPVGSYLSIRPDTAGACARWELTDGIATINVTQTRRSVSSAASTGDVQGQVETTRRGDFHFIVRGNVSRSELKSIADGIEL